MAWWELLPQEVHLTLFGHVRLLGCLKHFLQTLASEANLNAFKGSRLALKHDMELWVVSLQKKHFCWRSEYCARRFWFAGCLYAVH